ncbi:hypothetical protein ILYODFUR_026595 [Ilyodon furcidens]|uniref:Uncharacterized protein n=1 Tax=Ilyodon furcidens TaxID=33524 RepID=A0ABV0TM70_9TELE
MLLHHSPDPLQGFPGLLRHPPGLLQKFQCFYHQGSTVVSSLQGNLQRRYSMGSPSTVDDFPTRASMGAQVLWPTFKQGSRVCSKPHSPPPKKVLLGFPKCPGQPPAKLLLWVLPVS